MPDEGGLNDTIKSMPGLLIGYARVSTNDQDLTAQKNALLALGVPTEKTFTDQGLTGTNRARPGLGEALAACRGGDTLVVTKLALRTFGGGHGVSPPAARSMRSR